MNSVAVPSALLDQTVQFVEIASLATKRAVDEVQLHRQAQKRAADGREDVLKYMVDNGLVQPGQKAAAEAMLGSHAETMSLLKSACVKLVDAKKVKTATDLGQAVEPAKAHSEPGQGRLLTKESGDYDSENDPMVGRKTNFVKESDRAFLALIGK